MHFVAVAVLLCRTGALTKNTSAWDESWIASDTLSCGLQSGKVVDGTSSDALSYDKRLGLQVRAYLPYCRLRVACTSGRGECILSQ